MSSARAIKMATLIASALSVSSATASANPLVSGYGGPGQGSQVILGSTLLNGPRGPGGSVGSGGIASLESVSAHGGSPAPISSRAAVPGRPARALGHAGKPTARVSAPSLNTARPSPASSVAARSVTLDADAFGVSEDDLLYILLAAGSLLLTGVLTRRLARTPR